MLATVLERGERTLILPHDWGSRWWYEGHDAQGEDKDQRGCSARKRAGLELLLDEADVAGLIALPT